MSRQVVLAGDLVQGDDGATDDEPDVATEESAFELAIIELAVEQTRATFTVTVEPCAGITVSVVPSALVSGAADPCETRHQVTLTDLSPGTAYAVEVVGSVSEDGAEPVVAGALFVTSPAPAPPAVSISVSEVTETSAQVTVRATPCVSLDLRVTSTELGVDRRVARNSCETEHIVALGRDGDAPLLPGVKYGLSALVRSEVSTATTSAEFSTADVPVVEQLELTSVAVTPVEGGIEVVFQSSKCGVPAIDWFQTTAQDVGGRQTAGPNARCATTHRSLIPNLAPGTDYVVNISVVTPEGERGRRRLDFRTP